MKVTESSSNYENLEEMSVLDILSNMNKEDQTVPLAVGKIVPQISAFVEAIVPRMAKGGRLFYIGAGTSGRLGILDASECPPTYGVPHDLVIGLIAGGDHAIRKAVENAEDDPNQAWSDIQEYGFNANDTVIGIAASGTTPYVIGGVRKARHEGLLTGAITCNPNSPLSKEVDFPLEAVVGPEFVTGSTRMKAGTAQKLVLNMISTSVMIKLGRVKGNKMVDMQLSNAKLVERGTRMIMEATNLPEGEAKKLLLEKGSVRAATDYFQSKN
ncbi:N-acetylmuramic acid 6-phosphate etherase [Algoriphagus sediminis]|uniref:N-acetylmuramic acid 6-phosphate etherase n=1 Tax=Algoriphagus sediminis TaxID=3057113 RepID=A0ABT7YEB7_9BACT|nr:N-acetylmuramic acid 6-phosphate etherase [Algoriphagus sediminis]MDN3204864.1 N-acetylmuramic acid 6-phosphate etherase [Algoriphagus sediminis]